MLLVYLLQRVAQTGKLLCGNKEISQIRYFKEGRVLLHLFEKESYCYILPNKKQLFFQCEGKHHFPVCESSPTEQPAKATAPTKDKTKPQISLASVTPQASI